MNFIPVNEPLLNGNEKKYVNECLDSGWISSEGPFVKKFEDEFAARVSRKHGIAVSSGTGALDAAIDALRIGVGDEIIMPTFTIISCINQIVRSGAKAVLVDSDPLTWNMDASQIEAKITSRTKAIMLVHIYGLPVNIDAVMDIARRHDLKVLEDAAQMHGQTYKGKPCGSFGDVSTFSFYPNKHITTGEGGMIVTDDDELAANCRDLRNLCFQSRKRFVHERLGWNLRMTNMQAALGLAQLEQLDSFVARKRRMGALYNALLNDMQDIQRPLARTDYAENIYWVYGLVLGDSIEFDAKQAIEQLAENGVGCRPFFCPMHQQPVLHEMGLHQNESHPNAQRLYQRGFYIPSGLALTDEQIEAVAQRIGDIVI